MPRNLARLKFRAPKPTRALNVSGIRVGNQRALSKEVKNYVLQHSKPTTALSLSVFTDPKWKRQPGTKTRKWRHKPFTLKDLVDPEGKKKHGEVIYVFRNKKTNQVIYSLSEMLDNYHLDQLPFMGKHSKPPVIRPDEWTPHLVALFPTPAQGQHAFRTLREYRKLHELCWDQTNPEYRSLSRVTRMKKIMDQVANTSADLAAVLSNQEKRAARMEEETAAHETKAKELMDKKWAEIDDLANKSLAEDKRDGDNVEWLQAQIKSLDVQLKTKFNQKPAEQARLKKAKTSHESRIRKIEYAQRKAAQFKQKQDSLLEEAALANADGAEEKLRKLQSDINLLEHDIAHPGTDRTNEDDAFDRKSIRDYKRELSLLETSFAAKKSHDERDHYIARSVLPPQLRTPPPTPFVMDIEIQWADLRDAEFAAGSWPDAVTQDILPIHAVKESVAFLNQQEFDEAVEGEVKDMIEELENEAAKEAEEEEEAIESVPEKKGVLDMLKGGVFKRAATA